MIKVSDYIAGFLSGHVRYVFTVSGAGDLHLLDSIRKRDDLDFICNHHEQASAMGAYAYARTMQQMGVCIVTTGPGATNAITGMVDFWVDSVPGLIISGQVQRKYLSHQFGVRQNGIQEINIIDMVSPVTKFAAVVDDPLKIKWFLQKAAYEAQNGRPGPVWLDIPMDVQSAVIDEAELVSFEAEPEKPEALDIGGMLQLVNGSQRPLILVGHGIKAARAVSEMKTLLGQLSIPVCVSWNGIDLVETDDPYYVGRFGTYGQRGANFAVQNCDLLISIGSRLNITQTGYEYHEFARAAKKIYVDIDSNELKKFPIPPDYAVHADAGVFIRAFLQGIEQYGLDIDRSAVEQWLARTQEWKKRYPVNLPEYKDNEAFVNTFSLIDEMTLNIGTDAVIIPTASGSGYTSFHQAANIKKGQTVFTSNGFAEMGFDIPGAIGAAIASGKTIWQMTGDGGVQMNLQELQTLVHHQLPVKLFIHSNQGYLTIRHTQNGLFKGEYSASSKESGVSLPSFEKIAYAYGIPYFQINQLSQLKAVMQQMEAVSGPALCEVMMDPAQPLVPKTSFKILPDGRLVSPPIEDLFPFLDRDEFLGNMIVDPIKDM